MQRETRTCLRYTLKKDFCYKLISKQAIQNELDYKAILFYSKALAIKHRASRYKLLTANYKSLLFLALACLKNLGLSSEELLALVMLSILRRIIVDNNSAQSLLTLMLISLSYSYATALLRV
ncbi:hypothetical protein HBI24_234480 [Parastagonospora nodorum]|nr:hypothetical protein HBI24_234480 [Parastagonospora nodorum]